MGMIPGSPCKIEYSPRPFAARQRRQRFPLRENGRYHKANIRLARITKDKDYAATYSRTDITHRRGDVADRRRAAVPDYLGLDRHPDQRDLYRQTLDRFCHL